MAMPSTTLWKPSVDVGQGWTRGEGVVFRAHKAAHRTRVTRRPVTISRNATPLTADKDDPHQGVCGAQAELRR